MRLIFHMIIDYLRKNTAFKYLVLHWIIQFPFLFSRYYSLVNQTMTRLDPGQVRRVLTEALDVWSRGSRLTFQEVYSEDADIQVLFAK